MRFASLFKHPSLSNALSAFPRSGPRVSLQYTTMSILQDRVKGTCKWFNVEKGYGFITPVDGSPDVFVHQTSIQANGFRSLAEGESVEFEIVVDPKTGRNRAASVTGPDGGNVQGAPYRGTSSREYP